MGAIEAGGFASISTSEMATYLAVIIFAAAVGLFLSIILEHWE